MDISQWIKPLGIVTYTLIAVTLITGLFRAKLHLKLKHHKILAYLAIGLATLHGALVLILF